MRLLILNSYVAAFCVAASTTAFATESIAPASDQPAAQAARKPFNTYKKACGTKADVHLCDVLKPSDTGQRAVSSFEVKFPGKGVAIVTWQGSAFCAVSANTTPGTNATGSHFEYYVHLALQDDGQAIDFNGPGASSIGERSSTSVFAPGANGAMESRTALVPVTLSRAFPIEKSGTVKYRAVALGNFRDVRPPDGITNEAFCNINGGAMTVQYAPD